MLSRAFPLLILLASSPVLAGEKAPPPGATVEMPYLIAPLTAGGDLASYAYITPRIIGTSASAAVDIRGKTAFIQDAFVRDVNAASVGRPDKPGEVDSQALLRRLTADVKRIMGAGKVAAVTISQMQIASLRASRSK